MLSLLLAIMLVPQVPVYALEGEATPQEQATFTTLSEAEDAGAISPVPSDPQGYVADEVLVVLAGENAEASELAAVEESVVELSETDDAAEVELLSASSDEDPLALVELPADVSVEDALLQLANDENVAFAQPNYRYTLMDDEFEDNPSGEEQLEPADNDSAFEPLATYTNDPYASSANQWWLGAVKAYDAWDRQKVNQTITIAIIDTGVRLTHDDLDDNILTSLAWDAYRKQALTLSVSQSLIPNEGDMNGHGTHVAGIAAAETNNNLLGAGVSYNAKILPINVFYTDKGGELTATTTSVRDAFDYIISRRNEANIRVVNMSFGGSAKADNDSLLHAKIQTAKNLGILSVCAAGNSGGSVPNYPSDYEEVIAVTNVQQDGSSVVINNTSDHNAYKDIAAPGTNIKSTYYSNDTSFASLSGTSMATPVVSGIAALLFAKNPNLTPDQVKQVLYGTATDLGNPGRDNHYGHGLVNASAALAVLDQRYTVSYDPGAHGTWTVESKTTNNLLYGVPTPAFSGNTNTEHHVGYTFAGWNPAWQPTVAGNVTYIAAWSANSYTVTFNPNGGSVSPTNITRTYNSSVGTLHVPTRAGHTFTGWYTAPSGGAPVSPSTKVTGDVIYYARWSINSYTATFDPNGGSVFPANTTRTYNSAIGALPTPTRLGFAFDGWYTAP
ncbi:MAG: S8 family serine peptidase, partial [Coriobacteriales bacterium]|nr:S8 family serine peptidase [Coriobacteriales bacterium]